jgi:uncharacterized protein (TIGR03084 family)
VPAPPSSLTQVVTDLEAEHDDLDRLVADLGEPAWDAPTPAQGWAVRDQISHLAFFDDAAVMAMDEPEAFTAMAEAAMASGGDPMAEHLRRGRAMAGAEVLAWWRGARAVLADRAGALEPGARVVWFGPPMGALSFVSARLMETWAHGQDVADALGASRTPTPRLRHIAHLGVRARPFSYLVRGRDMPDVPITVDLVAPDMTHWVWGDEAGDSSTSPAGDVVRGSALDFCLVVTQRRNVADTALEVEGAAATEWLSIAQAFAGPPGPGRPRMGTGAGPDA